MQTAPNQPTLSPSDRNGFVLLASLLLFLFYAMPSAGHADMARDLGLADEYGDWFMQQAAKENLVGAAFAVVSKQGILRTGTVGFTDTRHTQAVDGNTVFRIASVSKTFAAGLTAQLAQDGTIAWDDPVIHYVPGLRVKGDAGRIRIQDLLGQSTGLISHAYDNLIEDGVPTDQIFEKLADLPYNCAPGSCYSYQNSVFSLIQPVVEQATSTSYELLVEQRIFKPLDMQTASVGYERFLATSNRAEPHVKSNGQWRTVKVLPNYYRVAPAAGVNASILDMAKWLEAQLGSDPLVVTDEARSLLVEPRVKTPRELQRREWKRMVTDAHYGLGWRVYQLGETRIAYHSGWVSGYRADIAYSPSHGIGVTVLMNAESSSISLLTTQFWELAEQRFKPEPIAP